MTENKNKASAIITVGYKVGRLWAFNKAGKTGTTPGTLGLLTKTTKDVIKATSSFFTAGAFDEDIYAVDTSRGNFQKFDDGQFNRGDN